MKKVTAKQIIDNLNAQIKLSRAQNIEPYELQSLLDTIVRHHNGFENIEDNTAKTLKNVERY